MMRITRNVITREWIQGWSVLLNTDFMQQKKLWNCITRTPKSMWKKNEQNTKYVFRFRFFFLNHCDDYYLHTKIDIFYFCCCCCRIARWYCDESFGHYSFTRLTYDERCAKQCKRPRMNRINWEIQQQKNIYVLNWHDVLIRSRLSTRLCLNNLWLRAVWSCKWESDDGDHKTTELATLWNVIRSADCIWDRLEVGRSQMLLFEYCAFEKSFDS